MNSVSSYLGKIAWGVRYVGLFDTALIFAAKLIHIFLRPFAGRYWSWHFTERRFDKRMGIETAAMVPVDELDVDESRKEGAIRYEPTPFLEFGYVTSRLPIDHARYSFVDLGSGKGRVLMMALKFPFREVLGVEFSPQLHETAEANLAAYCDRFDERRACRSVCADATTVKLPEEPLVLYMFNPFKTDVFKRVLENIRRSYERNPRHLMIVYKHPADSHLLDGSGFLTRTRSELGDRWLVYETAEGRG